jgi:hypothetical protein
MCVYNMYAHSSTDSFTVGSGVWSVFVIFSLPYFGTQSRILFPQKYFSHENLCVYGSSNDNLEYGVVIYYIVKKI